MTNTPVPNPYAVLMQRFGYVMACLNEIDPKLGDEAWRDIMQQAAEDVREVVDAMHAGSGFKRETSRDDKVLAFERRDEQRWAYQGDVIPKNYQRDAKEAFEIGAMIPGWVLMDAVRFGASWDKRYEAINGRTAKQITAPEPVEAY